MTPEQLKLIEAHGRQLLEIFPNATERDPVKLCKKLRRIEVRANKRAEAACSYPCKWNRDEGEAMDAAEAQDFAEIDKLLSWVDSGVPVIINRDPRGYALKIDDVWMRNNQAELARDWGGYGLIAPEITGADDR